MKTQADMKALNRALHRIRPDARLHVRECTENRRAVRKRYGGVSHPELSRTIDRERPPSAGSAASAAP